MKQVQRPDVVGAAGEIGAAGGLGEEGVEVEVALDFGTRKVSQKDEF